MSVNKILMYNMRIHERAKEHQTPTKNESVSPYNIVTLPSKYDLTCRITSLPTVVTGEMYWLP